MSEARVGNRCKNSWSLKYKNSELQEKKKAFVGHIKVFGTTLNWNWLSNYLSTLNAQPKLSFILVDFGKQSVLSSKGTDFAT